MPVKIKKIYKPYLVEDGYCILLDRLRPRGIKNDDAHIDKWVKGIAPSTELRQWYHENPEPGHWEQFVNDYQDELKNSIAVGERFADIENHPTVTLLYA